MSKEKNLHSALIVCFPLKAQGVGCFETLKNAQWELDICLFDYRSMWLDKSQSHNSATPLTLKRTSRDCLSLGYQRGDDYDNIVVGLEVATRRANKNLNSSRFRSLLKVFNTFRRRLSSKYYHLPMSSWGR
jgi:hypothetical protein